MNHPGQASDELDSNPITPKHASVAHIFCFFLVMGDAAAGSLILALSSRQPRVLVLRVVRQSPGRQRWTRSIW